MAVSFAPLVLPFVYTFFHTGVTVLTPSSLEGAHQNHSFSESENYRGTILFEKNIKLNEYSFFGISTSPPLVKCNSEGAPRIIQPHHWISNTPIYSKLDLNCEGTLSASLIDRVSIPANAWSVPFLISGKEDRVAGIVKAMMFYFFEFRPMLALIAFFQIGLTLLFAKTIGQAFKAPHNTYSFIVVAFMAIVNGGLIEKMSGITLWDGLPIIKYFLSNLWFSVFAVETLYFKINKKVLLVVGLATLGITFAEMNLGFSPQLTYSILIIAWGTLACFLKFRFLPTILFLLNASYLFPVFTPIAILPVFAASFFLMVYMFGYQLEFIKILLLDWRLTQMASRIHSQKGCDAYTKLVSRTFKAERVSLAIAKKDSFEYRVFSKSRQTPVATIPETESSVILKVYATGESLLDLSTQSKLGSRISNKGSAYSSDNFTAVPITINSEIAGVLCITDYESGVKHADVRDSLVKSFLSFGKNLALAMSNSNNNQCSKIVDVVKVNLNSDSGVSIEPLVKDLLSVLYEKFGISGYFSRIHADDQLEVLIGGGNLTDQVEILNGLKFTVNPNNEFGPISLAFKDSKPVILQNWKPISDKLSAAAKRIYIELQTNSIMTVPIVKTVGTTTIRYLLWLQTDSRILFSQQFLPLGQLIQIKLEKLVDYQLSKLVNDTVLSLAESDSIHAIVHGQNTRIEETGELLMFDLGKSTPLSGALGAIEFKKFIDFYTKETIHEMTLCNFKLQMVLGDALLFTKPDSEGSTPREILLNAVYRCDKRIKEYAEKYAPNIYKDNEPSLRLCSAIGDISRDLERGKGGGWAIVGSTISEVHKIESIAKKYRSGFYFELESRVEKSSLEFVKTDSVPWPGASTVRYIAFTNAITVKAA